MSQELARARYYSYWISVLIKFERKRDHRTQTDWRKERERRHIERERSSCGNVHIQIFTSEEGQVSTQTVLLVITSNGNKQTYKQTNATIPD